MDEIRLTCESCGARYRLAPGAVPPQGREVECTACGHIWFARPQPAPAPAPASASAQMTIGSDPEDPAGDDDQPPRLSRPLPANVLAILRNELEFEQRARAAETTAETTTETTAAPESAGDDPPPAPGPVAPPPPAAVHDIVQPKPDPQAQAQAPDRRKRGYRTGFALAAMITALVLSLYALAPALEGAGPFGTSLNQTRTSIDQTRERLRAALFAD